METAESIRWLDQRLQAVRAEIAVVDADRSRFWHDRRTDILRLAGREQELRKLLAEVGCRRDLSIE